MIAKAVVGGVIGGVVNGVMTAAFGGDTKSIVTSVLVGAVTGAVGAFDPFKGSYWIAGAVAGLVSGVSDYRKQAENGTPDLVKSIAVGFSTGLITVGGMYAGYRGELTVGNPLSAESVVGAATFNTTFGFFDNTSAVIISTTAVDARTVSSSGSTCNNSNSVNNNTGNYNSFRYTHSFAADRI